jgi:hypothetical protein
MVKVDVKDVTRLGHLISLVDAIKSNIVRKNASKKIKYIILVNALMLSKWNSIKKFK